MAIRIENSKENIAFAEYKKSNIKIPESDIYLKTYISNKSVNKDLIEFVYPYIAKYSKMVDEFEGTKKEVIEKIVNVMTFILTQECRIIVRHDRWLYFFNGKYYERLTEQELCCKIRELSENAAIVWKTFSCNSKISYSILKNVSEAAVHVDYPDDISKYIIMNNGVLNLENMKLEPFTPNRFMTSMVNADWINEEDVPCPHFERIINTYTQDDTTLNDRIKETLGVCLTNDYVKKFFCFLGVTNSGKSFLLNFLMKLINTQSSVVMQPNDFKRQFAPSMVYGKSLCCCMDMDSAPLNSKATAFIKGVSGFDILSAEFKGENGCVPFQSRAHIINASNFDITSKTPDTAFDMRKLVIPFRVRLTDNAEPFEVLMNHLESEKSAIVKMLINAYINLKNNDYVFSGTGSWYDNYVPPTDISISTNKSLEHFFTENYIYSHNNKDFVFTEDMYDTYRKFAAENDNLYWFENYDVFSKAVKTHLTDLKSDRKRKNSKSNPKRGYYGITPKTSSPEEVTSDNPPSNDD